jgi:hypothetical protein
MKLVLSVVVSLLAAGSVAQAAPGDGDRRADAPRLLKEGLKAGDADFATFAAIADWILHEKEEKVAAGILGALAEIEPRLAGRDGERWNATTLAMMGLFKTALRDAQANHRPREGEIEAEISGLVKAAAPAVAATLQETDPRLLESLREALGAVAPNTCERPPVP